MKIIYTALIAGLMMSSCGESGDKKEDTGAESKPKGEQEVADDEKSEEVAEEEVEATELKNIDDYIKLKLGNSVALNEEEARKMSEGQDKPVDFVITKLDREGRYAEIECFTCTPSPLYQYALWVGDETILGETRIDRNMVGESGGETRFFKEHEGGLKEITSEVLTDDLLDRLDGLRFITNEEMILTYQEELAQAPVEDENNIVQTRVEMPQSGTDITIYNIFTMMYAGEIQKAKAATLKWTGTGFEVGEYLEDESIILPAM